MEGFSFFAKSSSTQKKTVNMMTFRTAYLALVLLAFGGLSSCTLYKDVEVSEVKDVRFKGFDEKGIVAEVVVEITNPNGYKLKAQSATIDVTMNGKHAGTVTFDEEYIIPKKSKDTYTFTLNGAFSGTSGGFLDNLLNLLINRKATVVGKGYVEGRALGIKRKVDVDFTEEVDMRNMNR